MRLGADVFVSAQAADEADAIAVRGEIATVLAPLLEQGQITGYRAVAVASEEDWDDEDIGRGAIEDVTGGVLPIVYLIVSYDGDDPAQPGPDVGRVIDGLSLRLVVQVPPAG